MSVQQKNNWTDLPDDIKRTIFDFNRKDASIKKQQNKNRYEMVVGDIKAQMDNLECNTLGTDYDEYGREIDEIIRPRNVLKTKQEFADRGSSWWDGEENFFRFYREHYYPHINYDEFVVRFRQAIQ